MGGQRLFVYKKHDPLSIVLMTPCHKKTDGAINGLQISIIQIWQSLQNRIKLGLFKDAQIFQCKGLLIIYLKQLFFHACNNPVFTILCICKWKKYCRVAVHMFCVLCFHNGSICKNYFWILCDIEEFCKHAMGGQRLLILSVLPNRRGRVTNVAFAIRSRNSWIRRLLSTT